MPDTFMIGLENTIYELLPLADLLETGGGLIDPDWSYQPFATSIQLGDGTLKGQGFPIVKWRWNHMANAQREILKELCPDLSATVYIHTPTNESTSGELIWGTFQAIMQWMDTDEDKQVDKTLGIILTFTHCVLVP